MKKIERFQITGMTISGFKCYQVPTILDFGPQTAITGGNGLGKTSIADAIAFAITGLPFFRGARHRQAAQRGPARGLRLPPLRG